MTDMQSICNAKHLNHVCIAVKNIETTLNLYATLFGTDKVNVVNLHDQSVKAALIRMGTSQIEFIQPTDPNGSVARFIDRRGEGLHHICLEVDDLSDKLDRLNKSGVRLIDRTPRPGLSGTIAFLHPDSTQGILVELVDASSVKRG